MLQQDNHLQSVGGRTIATPSELVATTKERAGQTVDISLVRNGQPLTVSAQLRTHDQAKSGGYLGVGSQQSEKIYSTWSAPLAAVATTGQLTYETLKGVGTVLIKSIYGFFGQFVGSDSSRQAARADLANVSENVAGPIGILGVLFPSVVDHGIDQVILLAAIISLTLAVMNILPIPALDGGRWATMAGFRLFGKSLTKEREETVQATGMLILLTLTLIVTANDIGKLF